MKNKFLELLLFINSLFTETVTSFLIPDCDKNTFIKCFNETVLQISVYQKSSLLKNLHMDHKFLRKVTYANLVAENRARSSSQEYVKYVLKMY